MGARRESVREPGVALPPRPRGALVDAPPPRAVTDTAAASRREHDIVTRETFHRPADDAGVGWIRHPLTKADYVIAVAVLVAALAARWPFVAVGHTLLNPDEAIVGLMSMDIAAGDALPIYFYGQRYMGALEAYVIAAVSPMFDDVVHALKFGPACVFALFALVQYLMLTRWFGRRGGLIGAAAIVAASPMFVHWSISARGGYVEVLLCGTALLWAYTEWFVPGAGDSEKRFSHGRPEPRRESTPPLLRRDGAPVTGWKPVPQRQRRRRFLLGLLIGFGLWINPSIALFVAPIVLHALLHRPLAALDAVPPVSNRLASVRNVFGRATLPVLLFVAVAALNSIWSVWVEDGRVHNLILLGLLPRAVAGPLLAVAMFAAGFVIVRRTEFVGRVRALVMANAGLILGALIGATPAVIYTVQTLLHLRPLDPSLPMGLRPLWLTGETLVYLLYGLPLLLAADPRPFVQLMGAGRPDAVRPLDVVLNGLVNGADWLVIGGLVTVGVVLMAAHRGALGRLLRLRPGLHPPAVLLMLAVSVTVGLFVLGGCTMNFSTIRYLVPLWAFIPGLLAAACIRNRFHVTGTAGVPHPCAAGAGNDGTRANYFNPGRLTNPGFVATACLLAAWTIGQFGLHAVQGRPHPLQPVADALIARGIDRGIAEPLDAHLLSFMTDRRCRLAEFESFWTRFPHHRDLIDPDAPTWYVVETGRVEWTDTWTRAGWPGWAPPETLRFLWPRLQWLLNQDPSLLISREPIAEGYELFRLKRPAPER